MIDNVQARFAGGCRTAIEIKMDRDVDPRLSKGRHQVVVCGKHDALLKAYGELSGIKVVQA